MMGSKIINNRGYNGYKVCKPNCDKSSKQQVQRAPLDHWID